MVTVNNNKNVWNALWCVCAFILHLQCMSSIASNNCCCFCKWTILFIQSRLRIWSLVCSVPWIAWQQIKTQNDEKSNKEIEIKKKYAKFDVIFRMNHMRIKNFANETTAEKKILKNNHKFEYNVSFGRQSNKNGNAKMFNAKNSIWWTMPDSAGFSQEL